MSWKSMWSIAVAILAVSAAACVLLGISRAAEIVGASHQAPANSHSVAVAILADTSPTATPSPTPTSDDTHWG